MSDIIDKLMYELNCRDEMINDLSKKLYDSKFDISPLQILSITYVGKYIKEKINIDIFTKSINLFWNNVNHFMELRSNYRADRCDHYNCVMLDCKKFHDMTESDKYEKMAILCITKSINLSIKSKYSSIRNIPCNIHRSIYNFNCCRNIHIFTKNDKEICEEFDKLNNSIKMVLSFTEEIEFVVYLYI